MPSTPLPPLTIKSPSNQILYPTTKPKQMPKLCLPPSAESLSCSKPIKSSFTIKGATNQKPAGIKYLKLNKYVLSTEKKLLVLLF